MSVKSAIALELVIDPKTIVISFQCHYTISSLHGFFTVSFMVLFVSDLVNHYLQADTVLLLLLVRLFCVLSYFVVGLLRNAVLIILLIPDIFYLV